MDQSATRPRAHLRRPTRLVPIGSVLVVLFSTLGLALGPAASASAAVDAADPSTPAVLVVAVPDLLWSDLSPTRTPTMWQLLSEGSSGLVSVKSSYDLAGCADGLLTLGAGSRAAAESPSAPARPCADPVAGRSGDVDLGRRLATTAGLGALADALRAHGVRTAALGSGAALALPQPDITAPLSAGLSATDGARVVLAVDDAIYSAPAADRGSAVAAVDRQLAALVAPLPPSATVLLVGSSDRPATPDRPTPPASAHLHVAIARGPDFPAGWLRSPSTERSPYVELIDVAPTVLGLVDVPVPSSVVGRPWHHVAGPHDAATRAAHLRDLDVKAVQGARWRPVFMWAVSGLALLVAVAGSLIVVRRVRSRVRPAVEFACYLVALLPFASWLIQLVPWWRWNILWLPVLLLAVSGVGALVAALAARRSRVWGVLVVTGASAALLLVDLLTGTRLQTSALLGDSPITAGRFYGAGNTAFGVLAASALIGAALAAAVPPERPRRAAVRGAVLAGLALLVVALVDAVPTLGADVGGGLALMPSAAVLVLLLARVRLTVRRLVTALAVGAIPVVALALWDYHRPPERRTHIGQFVAQIVDGQAGHVIARKISANLGQLVSSPFLPLVVGAVVLVAVVLWRHRPLVERTVGSTPGLVPAVWGFTLCAVLGALLNDSGVTVTGIMLSVALPAVTALALSADPIDDR